MRISTHIALFILLMVACIDPIEFQIVDPVGQIVVDGMITDQAGPYTVEIFRQANLKYDLTKRLPIIKSTVTMFDDQGNSELMTEVDRGIYKTAPGGMQGVIGRSYHLRIVLLDGRVFESVPDKLNPVGEIDSIYHEFERGNPAAGIPDGYGVYMDSKMLLNEETNYRWRWEGTYKVETFPHLRTVRTQNGGIAPAPEACSGYRVQGSGILHVGDCTCCICWIGDYEETPMLSDGQFVANLQFRRIRMGFIPITRRTFYEKYRASVQQMNLTRAAYNYWKLIDAQKEGVGSLFQPPSGEIRGNIFPKNNSDTPIGMFYAAGFRENFITITKSEIPSFIPAIDTARGTCLLLKNATNVQPQGWE